MTREAGSESESKDPEDLSRANAALGNSREYFRTSASGVSSDVLSSFMSGLLLHLLFSVSPFSFFVLPPSPFVTTFLQLVKICFSAIHGIRQTTFAREAR